MNSSQTEKKSVSELDSLVKLLTPKNQAYVLNTIETLLHRQRVNEEGQKEVLKFKIIEPIKSEK